MCEKKLEYQKFMKINLSLSKYEEKREKEF